MAEATITYSPFHVMPVRGEDNIEFVPRFEAKIGGELYVSADVRLSRYAASLLIHQIEGEITLAESAGDVLCGLVVRYGLRRFEALVTDLLSRGANPDTPHEVWALKNDDLPELRALWAANADKCCEYQQRVRRDLFCLAPSPRDGTASRRTDGLAVAPTSRAVCKTCDVPDTDLVCSSLMHPEVTANNTLPGVFKREVLSAMCDQGRSEVDTVSGCRAGRHSCWRRTVETPASTHEPLSPMSLPESFDVLDALWRLSFGRNKRLLTVTTLSGPAALTLDCASRTDFESRLSALADVIDKLTVDATLLPSGLSQDELRGSLDKVERCLLHQMPQVHHVAVTGAIQTLRIVRQARNALQHGRTEGGGFTASLRSLGIHDAPPNWAGAWDTIRVRTADALTILRGELRAWVDASS